MPPDWTRRPNAKDDLRAQARQLRADGQKYNDIAARLGVSKSSVSLWVRDLPTPPRLSPEENRKRSAEGAVMAPSPLRDEP
jgi:transposase